jgi:hypothetical protein
MGFGATDGRYPSFLKEKYGSVGVMNAAYGTDWQDFGEARPLAMQTGGTVEQRRRVKDYQDFYFQCAAEYAGILVDWMCAAGIDCENRAIPDNLLIGAGFNRMSAYVARVVEHQGQHLAYHHYAGNGGPPAFGLPKVLNADGDKLYLTAWTGIDALRRGELDLTGWKPLSNGPQAPGEWNVGGQVINGNCELGAAILRADIEAVDVDVEAELTIRSGARAGLVSGLPATPNAKGLACLLDAQAGEITIGEAFTWINASGPNLSQVIDSVRRPVERNRTYTVRLIHRHRYVELFIDGRLVFSTVTESVPQGGGIGCAVENAAADFNIRQAHRLEPMKV